MESALKSVVKSIFEEYVTGLENVDNMSLSGGSTTLKNLKLKEARINEALDENGSCPFSVVDGIIGTITVKPGWLGNVNIVASNVELNLSFSAMKAVKAAMRGDEPDDDEEDTQNQVPYEVQKQLAAVQPQRQPVPRFCTEHNTSEKRPKVEPAFRDCQSCKISLQTNYQDFALCPPCSESKGRCMICGAVEGPPPPPPPPGGNRQPQHEVHTRGVDVESKPHTHAGAPPGGAPCPAYCRLHDTSDKRKKGDPDMRTCRGCQLELKTNYTDFAYCPSCSEKLRRCMICGEPGSIDSKPTLTMGQPDAAAGPPAHGLPEPPPSSAQLNPRTRTSHHEAQIPAPPRPPDARHIGEHSARDVPYGPSPMNGAGAEGMNSNHHAPNTRGVDMNLGTRLGSHLTDPRKNGAGVAQPPPQQWSPEPRGPPQHEQDEGAILGILKMLGVHECGSASCIEEDEPSQHRARVTSANTRSTAAMGTRLPNRAPAYGR